MSEVATAPANGGSILRKRYLNVPLMYWAIGGVTILAVAAWQIKPSATVDGEDMPIEDDPINGGALAEQYPDMPTGTVIVAPVVPEADPTLDNASIETNDVWLKKGVAYLVTQGYGAGTAQAALQTYLEGMDMTYSQGKARDAVIEELGMPPNPPTIGKTSADIARKQGELPRYHTVRNSSEDSLSELANLYYGRSDTFAKDAIKNTTHYKSTYGSTRSENGFPVGSKIYIPRLPTPKSTPTVTNKTPTPKAPSKTSGNPAVAKYGTIRRGSRGKTVSYLQWYLGIKADGIFGPQTEAAVRAFQRRNGLVSDGIVGPKTWGKIATRKRGS